MRILFVHQNFPGQYRHIVHALAAQGGHQIVALGIEALTEAIPKSVQYYRYGLTRGNTNGIHDWVVETETKAIRGEACGRAAHQLREKGFYPDLICAHPGWGEALYLKDVWPNSPMLTYQEFYYNSSGFDSGFDPAMQGDVGWEQAARMRMKNANLLLSLQASDWSVTPTQFQRSSFPDIWQKQISCIHDGIDTSSARPSKNSETLVISPALKLQKGQPIVTFVNRSIEPYRGCHTFIRAIPEIQRLAPDATIVIVGKHEGVSYGKPAAGGSWRDLLLKEINGLYDPAKVFFVGTLNYPTFLQLLRITSCHVYLTYPFVLSWSLLEAMSSEAPIVGSDTIPVREVIRDGSNGLLVDFFSTTQLAESIAKLLASKKLANQLGRNARETILKKYDVSKCVALQLGLMELVAASALSSD
jgi:glycosyltransferase involved in cell wall biosynthesis